MSHESCGEMHLLIQADVDGELQPAEAARVGRHVAACAECGALQTELTALSGHLKQHLPRYRAPEHLRDAVRAHVSGPRLPLPQRRAQRWLARRWLAGGVAAGLAVAVCLALFAVLPRGGDAMPDWIVAAHIRGLQPDHLVDVLSSEQHTVKPWFAGRLPFSPPVKDLAADGFILTGARLDYLPGKTAAALVYKRRQHLIDLFVWPLAAGDDRGDDAGGREGYNFVRWQANGMAFSAVSDLNARELADFAAKWR